MEHTDRVLGQAPRNRGGGICWVWRYVALFAATATLSHFSLAATPSLTLGSASGAPGSAVTLPMTFDPGALSVAGIQFNLVLPSGLSTGTVTTGAIVTNAGKVLSTNVVGSTWTFIIFGFNQTTIASGTLLTAQINISASAAGTYNIPITAVSYTDPNGTSITPGTSTGGTVTVTVTSSSPTIKLTKSESVTTAKSGDTVTYTIQYQNTSANTATSTTITDVIPTGTTLVSGSITGGGTLSGNTITWTLGTITGGGSGQVSFQVTVN